MDIHRLPCRFDYPFVTVRAHSLIGVRGHPGRLRVQMMSTDGCPTAVRVVFVCVCFC